MLGLIQKLVLTIVAVTTGIAMAFAFYTVVFEENNRFEYEMLILLALSLFGLLSFVFHLKTIGFYKHHTLESLSYPKGKPFWVFNLVFVGSLLALACLFIYLYLTAEASSNMIFYRMVPFITIPSFLAVWLLLDARYLYRSYKSLQAKTSFNTIDDIKGVEAEDTE
jgi:hypothetical protein